MRLLLLLALLTLQHVSVFGEISVEGIHKEHRPIVVSHEIDDHIAVLYWLDGVPRQLPEDFFERESTKTTFGAPPGLYIVTVKGSQIITVTPDDDSIGPEPVPDPTPQPTPIPDPEPTPDPEPGPTPDYPGAMVVVVEETSDRNTETGKLLNAKFWTELKSRDISYRFLDRDTDIGKQYADLVERLPAMVIVKGVGEDANKVLYRGDLPKTTAEVDQLIKQHTGR